MVLSSDQKIQIEHIITQVVLNKLENYKPETSNNMPFHNRIMGKDRMALFSFVHSINTVMGSSIFEQLAQLVAEPFFQRVEHSYKVPSKISNGAEKTISNIMDTLGTKQTKPDLEKESQDLWKKRNDGGWREKKLRKIDLFLLDKNNKAYFLDIKTAKPNIDGFEKLKRNTLEWLASYYGHLDSTECPDTFFGLAIPYNPYAPKPYKRWTLQGMFEEEQLLVGEEFWNFLALGKPVYEEILDCFERVGMAIRPKIDDFANSINKLTRTS